MTKDEINQNRNIIKKCPCCNANIEDRTISLYTGLIKELYQVCKWCKEKGIHEFKMIDIRHLLSPSGYTRFGDLVRFGGIVYKKEKASYGINMERAIAFFKGESQIPLYLTVNQITGEVVDSKKGYISEIKSLSNWLNTENRLYNSRINPYKNDNN